MGIPAKLKNFSIFLDGTRYAGVCSEFTPPKLAIKTEEWQAGGMAGPIPIDMGLEKLEAEFTMGGYLAGVLSQFGAMRHDAVLLRFAGSYESDGSGAVRAIQIVCRGRYGEIDWGNASMGKDTEHKAKLMCSYVKITVDGRDVLEIDLLGCKLIVDGVDRYAERRAAIGL